MTTVQWLALIVSIVLITAVLYSWYQDLQRRIEKTCITCKKIHDSKNTLIECSECHKGFCNDNIEVTEVGGTSSITVVQVNPAKRNAENPCGSFFPNKSLQRRSYYCKLHTPRFTYRHRIMRID